MEKQEVSPHKWAKEIIAWANGAKVEFRLRDSDVWILQSNPGWFENNEYRIYDPLREIKEAFERGETIQGRMDNFSKWNNYNKNIGTISVESIKDSNGWEWRVKPDIKLEVGKDYIHVFGDWLVIDRLGNCGNLGFAYNGESFDSLLICSDPKYWREATKEEVKQFFERHLIKRYGEDWENVKIKECMYFVESDLINTSVYDCYIKKSHLATIDGWEVWNNNGCLYYNGKWAEVLEEEEIEIGNWKICDNFGERVFRHIGPSAGSNLEWRKATKQEVLNAPNYDGTATHQDFPFEVGDKVIAKWAECPKVLTVKESVGKHKFKYVECAEDSYIDVGTYTWCYATEQEINPPKEVLYVPFEEEDKEQFRGKWIKRKEGNLEMKITRFETLSTNTFLIEGRSPKQLLEDFTFIDGAPFGKVK